MLRFNTFAIALVLASAIGLSARAQESSSTIKTEAPNETPTRRWNGEWQFELSGGGFSEGKDEGAAAMFSFQTKFDYRFNSLLSSHFEPEIDLFSGRLQERYDNDAYENRVGLGAGYLSFHPVKFGEVRAGVMSQDLIDNPLLISQHRAFPGVQEILSSETLPVNVKLVAQQLIPTSYSLNAERSEKEALPTFATQSVHLDYKDSRFKIEAMGGHFGFANLPDKVAFQSGQTGNSVFGGQVAPGSRLAYKFDGLFWRVEACTCFTEQPVQFQFKYLGIRNGGAPSDSRDGQMIGLGPRFIYGDHELEILYYRFFSESDSTVSRYSRSSIGYTNRIGDILEAELNFKKQGFKIKGQYVHAGTLANTPNQQTLTRYLLGVETEYAPF